MPSSRRCPKEKNEKKTINDFATVESKFVYVFQNIVNIILNFQFNIFSEPSKAAPGRLIRAIQPLTPWIRCITLSPLWKFQTKYFFQKKLSCSKIYEPNCVWHALWRHILRVLSKFHQELSNWNLIINFEGTFEISAGLLRDWCTFRRSFAVLWFFEISQDAPPRRQNV